jgi:hypothetical protein
MLFTLLEKFSHRSKLHTISPPPPQAANFSIVLPETLYCLLSDSGEFLEGIYYQAYCIVVNLALVFNSVSFKFGLVNRALCSSASCLNELPQNCCLKLLCICTVGGSSFHGFY